jgi:AcrR family transcriptional regulator
MTMQARKPDRRIERTHQLLRDALMELIEQKGYDSITVQEIADHANVARTTFYLHFKDKDELLFNGMRQMYEELFQMAKVPTQDDPLGIGFKLDDPSDFEHVARYARFYKIMLSERGSIAFYLRVQDFLAQMFLESALKPLHQHYAPASKPNIPLEVVAYSCAGSEIAVIKWWLDQNMPFTPNEMAKLLKQLTLYGIPWAIGLPPEAAYK